MAVTSVMAKASNRSVKPEPGRAHGTLTRRTPQFGQSIRATRACRKAWCWKKSKCRQVFLTVSCTGQSALPHSAQAKRPPVLKSISMSSRLFSASKSAAATIHGGIKPRASWNRSISRIGFLLSPASAAILPPYSRPSRTGPHGRAIPRGLDRRPTRRQTTNAAGTKGWLRRGPNKRIDRQRTPRLAGWVTHSMQRGGEKIPIAERWAAHGRIGDVVAGQCEEIEFEPRVAGGERHIRDIDDAGQTQILLADLNLEHHRHLFNIGTPVVAVVWTLRLAGPHRARRVPSQPSTIRQTIYAWVHI